MADDPPADPDGPAATPEERRSRRALRRAAAAARRTDGQPRLLAAAKAARRLLPGDSEFGDPLSVTGEEVPSVIGRQLSGLNVKRPSVAREAGLTALQLWQTVSEAQGRGRGDEPLAILFTDLVGFSNWGVTTWPSSCCGG